MSECQISTPTRFGPLAPTLNSLRGLRFFSDEHDAGGDGANGDSGGDGGDEGEGSGDDDSNQQKSDRGGKPTPKPAGNREGTFSAKYVSEVRGEAAANRKAAAEQKARADAAERERDDLRAQVAENTRQSTIRKHSLDAGANADVLLDSTAFRNATKDLDLSKDEDVSAAIKAFLEKNPHASATPSGPGSSGPGRPGGSTSERADTSNSLSGAVSRAFGG